MNELTVKPLTETQRTRYLELLNEQPTIGNREALLQAGYQRHNTVGVPVTKAMVAALFTADPELRDDAAIARGRSLESVEDQAFKIALNGEHPKQADLVKFLLERRHPDYRAGATVDVNHSGEVTTPDVAAAIDRFTALADAAVRSATRNPEDRSSLTAD